LFNDQLTGSIPASIGNLVHLDNLDLSYNKLTGSIPSSIGNLTNLVWLDLSNNQLTDSIPYSISNLVVNLVSLNLNNNQLTGSIPSFIGNLAPLQDLDLSFNQLVDSIPSSIGNLANLTYLYLNNNQLTRSIPSSIGNLANLQYLSLNNNQLTGRIPSSIGNHANLIDLNLSNNQLSGSIPSSIGKLVNLHANLNLSHNRLTGSIPSSIGNLVYLGQYGGGLDLSYNRLSGPIPSSIANLKTPYVIVDLQYNHFTFDGMELVEQWFGSDATYSPQADIPVHQKGNTLSVYAGGTLSNNTYYWYNDGNLVATIHGDSTFTPTVTGGYTVKVKNSIAIALTLKSKDTVYFSALKSFSENNVVSQKIVFNNNLSVYPNPARDVLHVQMKEGTVSLLNQAGEILLTKPIHCSDVINVINLPSGLYYLKNMQTGEVKKVIISR
jgi:hypothetical protein